MKTNLDSIFKTDEKAELEGVIFQVKEGISFKLRRVGGANASLVRKALKKYYTHFAKQLDLGLLDENKEKEIQYKVFAEAVIIDWEGIELDGEIAPCTVDNAVKLFTRLPSLFDTLNNYASDLGNFRDDVGNF